MLSNRDTAAEVEKSIPPMTKEEAIELARRTAAAENWTWRGKVDAVRRRPLIGRPYWRIVTNYGCRGCNVRINIDDKSGEITAKGFMPR